jgi:hypothetical protein
MIAQIADFTVVSGAFGVVGVHDVRWGGALKTHRLPVLAVVGGGQVAIFEPVNELRATVGEGVNGRLASDVMAAALELI